MSNLDDLAKLEQAATGGKWEARRLNAGGMTLVEAHGDFGKTNVTTFMRPASAALIAAARNALPALLKVARAAKEVNKTYLPEAGPGCRKELDSALRELEEVKHG